MGGTRTVDGGDGARLQLLGAPSWAPRGDALSALAPRDALLLALLALDGPLTRPRAAALLWPDSEPRQANISLRQRIFRLKRAAGADVVAGDGAIRLADGVRHDLGDLEAGLRADPAHARGELLAGVEPPDPDDELGAWLRSARARWRARRLQALAALAEDHAAAGRVAAALPYAERLAAEDPAAEHAHRRLMRLHYLRGDSAAALEAYRRCAQALAREVGAEPGAETRALLEQIRQGGEPPAPGAVAPPPLALLRPPRLVGRDSAWRAIDTARREGRHLLLSGEPGIGKSRLLADYAAQAGIAVIDARPGDHAVPYAVLARLVDTWRQRFGAPVDPDARWAVQVLDTLARGAVQAPADGTPGPRVHAALQVWAAHAAAQGAAGAALDDLQFCDAATLEALLALLAHPVGPRWLLAVRAGERPPALDAWLAGPGGDATSELTLPPLDPAGVGELLASLELPGVDAAAWLPVLWRQAGGSPFFTLQALLAGVPRDGAAATPGTGALPAHLGQLLERRIAQLSPRALQVAEVAALAGADFSAALAAAVLGCHALDLAPAWRELESAQVLRDEAFAHDLVREAAERLVPAAIARELHRQIAAALDPVRVPPVRIARHHERAGQWPEAAQRYAEAAAALAAGRRAEQAQLLQAAAGPAHAPACMRGAWTCWPSAIGALVQAGSGDALRAAVAELQPLAARDGRAWLHAVVAAEAQIVFGDFAAVCAAMPQALEDAVRAGDTEGACLAARRLATALAHLGRPLEAVAVLQARRSEVEQSLPPQARGEFLCELGTLLERADRRAVGARELQAGIACALSCGDRHTAATALVNLGVNRVYWGDAAAAAAAATQGLQLRAALDGPGGLAAGFEMTLGAMQRDLGHYAQALEHLQHALQAFEADGNTLWVANTRSHLAQLWMHLGQWARAGQLLQPAGDGVPPFLQARLRAIQALLHEAAGHAALPGLDEALALIGPDGRADIRLAIELERLPRLPAEQALPRSDELLAESQARELMGHAVAARAARAQCACARAAAGGGGRRAHGGRRGRGADAQRPVPAGAVAGRGTGAARGRRRRGGRRRAGAGPRLGRTAPGAGAGALPRQLPPPQPGGRGAGLRGVRGRPGLGGVAPGATALGDRAPVRAGQRRMPVERCRSNVAGPTVPAKQCRPNSAGFCDNPLVTHPALALRRRCPGRRPCTSQITPAAPPWPPKRPPQQTGVRRLAGRARRRVPCPAGCPARCRT
ncbi:MAG: AAA family ATPase [Rubrivivax sp.]|nr:AAA family ATPase [Rubrivivax sp.]